MSAFWTRAGTWGIAYSQEPAGGGAASCLLATAYPAVVPALLSGIYSSCGSKNDKLCAIPNLQTRLAERLGGCGSLALLLGALLDWLLGTEVSECLLSGPAQARGGLPTARSQLAVMLPVVS
ncbi:hypothetical protein CSV65_16245 [Sporosarcina sp. P31]|nr:hypothetical protein CSV65_16245 [Sporosarcina sp. P31]PID10612.1 hypothetical protein CSV64_16200 [Sporosarcina sp. P32b]